MYFWEKVFDRPALQAQILNQSSEAVRATKSDLTWTQECNKDSKDEFMEQEISMNTYN